MRSQRRSPALRGSPPSGASDPLLRRSTPSGCTGQLSEPRRSLFPDKQDQRAGTLHRSSSLPARLQLAARVRPPGVNASSAGHYSASRTAILLRLTACLFKGGCRRREGRRSLLERLLQPNSAALVGSSTTSRYSRLHFPRPQQHSEVLGSICWQTDRRLLTAAARGVLDRLAPRRSRSVPRGGRA